MKGERKSFDEVFDAHTAAEFQTRDIEATTRCRRFCQALTLMRAVPRYREPPAWLMRFGIADIMLLGATFACLAGYLWA